MALPVRIFSRCKGKEYILIPLSHTSVDPMSKSKQVSCNRLLSHSYVLTVNRHHVIIVYYYK